ncbi:MAG: GTP pyrophosphokinase [Desulfobulbus propionicus]|nr:MAG: GTP pyrophosphokinase [Desulfobulbus propionicus]
MQYSTFDEDTYKEVMAGFIGHDESSQVFWHALHFACTAHRDQWRRSGDPYIMHPCNVARILAEELDLRDPEILAAALLHDTIEDVESVTREELTKKFGSRVAAIVDGCTKVTHYSGDRQHFKKMVHRKIFSGAAARPEVMLVKLADRLHNLRTLDSMPKRKKQRIAAETLDIYAPMATILGLFNIKREMFNLALAYKYPRQGAKLQSQIDKLQNDPEATDIVAKLHAFFQDQGVASSVTLRAKGLWGYYDLRNRILIKEIETPHEVLVLVKERQDCYSALGVLNEIFPPIPRTIRDFIANPKPSGYQGLHARANINGRKYLFKIRTKEMARSAQRGLVKDWHADSKARGRFVKEIKEMFDILAHEESVDYRDLIAARGRKEMYTYTPQGDLICLPVNSIVLDFAFRVHTAIGHTCIGAMVGNRRVTPDTRLRDGNVVKILRQESPVMFAAGIQGKCQTPKARSELAKAFRGRREAVMAGIGAAILRQELRRYGVPFEVLEKPEVEMVLARFNALDLTALFLELGIGRLHLSELISEIRRRLYADRPVLCQPTGVFNRVDLTTLDPVVMKSSACCKPNPLDKGIIGLLSERGLSLHRKDCGQLQKITFQREDAVEVRWKRRDTKIKKPQKLIVMDVSRQRLFMLLSVAPLEMKVLETIYLGKGANQIDDWEVTFRVADLHGLVKLNRHLRRSSLRYEFDLDF